MAAAPTATTAQPKKDRAGRLGQVVSCFLLAGVILWWWMNFGGSGHRSQQVGIGDQPDRGSPASAVTPSAGSQGQQHPTMQYLDINPRDFTGVTVNGYLGGGKYFHWALVDMDVTMDVMLNNTGQVIGREFARNDPRWTALRQTTVANRVDFRMTPGDRGTLKDTARVAYWYDDSPTDEYR